MMAVCRVLCTHVVSSVQCAVKGSTGYPRRSCCIETKWMAFRLLQYIFNNIWSIKWLVRSLPWKVSPHLAQLGGGSWPGWAQAGQVGVQNAIFGYVRLAQVLSLKQEKIQTTFICTWVWEAKSFPNRWGGGGDCFPSQTFWVRFWPLSGWCCVPPEAVHLSQPG